MNIKIPAIDLDFISSEDKESLSVYVLKKSSDSVLIGMYNRAIDLMHKEGVVSPNVTFLCGKIRAILDTRTLVTLVDRHLHIVD